MGLLAAQGRLARSSALVIGAGGLGSPAALYLAAAGIGRLGILDRDSVELNNLHRQIIHKESAAGVHKAISASAACRALNSSIQVCYAVVAQWKQSQYTMRQNLISVSSSKLACPIHLEDTRAPDVRMPQVHAHTEGLEPTNALSLVSQYDIVVDASDNAPTRYLLSDTCAFARKPLVSGAAIGTDGQLTVYCCGESGVMLVSI